MNLHSKKARMPIAALGVTALIAGAGALISPAFAVGETLTFLGADSNAASIVAIDPATSAAAAGVTFGVKVGGAPSSDSRALDVQVLTAPTSGAVKVIRVAGNAAPAAVTQATSAATTTSSPTLTFGTTPVFLVGDVIYSSTNVLIGTVTVVGLTSVTLAANAAVAVGMGDTLHAVHATTVSASTTAGTVIPSYAVGDSLYLGASVAGSYTLRFFKDTGGDGTYQANADDATPTFNLTVKSPADAFTATTPATVEAGTKGPAATLTSSLTTTDIRGGSPATLSANVAALLNVAISDTGTGAGTLSGTTGAATSSAGTTLTFASGAAPAFVSGDVVLNSVNATIGTVSANDGTLVTISPAAVAVSSGDVVHANVGGVTGENTSGAVTYDATLGYYRYLSTSSTTALTQGNRTPHTLSSVLSFNSGALSTKTTTVTANGVTSVTLIPKTGQTTDVTGTGANVKVRAGKDTVTYTATATDGTNGLAGKTVVFTLGAVVGGGTALADLTANGAAVPTTGSTAGQVSVTTDSNGVATLAVQSTKTANANAYTVNATSGTASGAATTVTYNSAVATTFTTSGGTSQTVGGSVTLKGKVLDQWSQGINTGGQATLAVTRGGGIGSDITRGVDVQSDGTFSTAVADATSNTTPHNDSYTWTIGSATGPSAQGIFWVTSLNVAAAAFTGLGANGTFPVPAAFTPTLANPTSTGAINLTGTLKDSSGNAMPYAPFVLSGTSGVLFQDDDGGLSTTLTGTATSTGLISDGTHAYVPVVLTSAGATTLTLTSGTTTATSGPFQTADPTVAWKVSVDDAASQPGSTIIITGKITDLFGNGVPNYNALLDLGSSTLGALGRTEVTTNDSGVFSTTFISGSNQNGVATLTATLETPANNGTAMTTDPLISNAYDATGLKVDAHGEYQDQAKITVAPISLTLSAAAHVTATAHGADAKLSGKFMPGTSVDIYGKESGAVSYSLVDSVTTDGEGDWGASEHVVKSTYFLAKAQGLSSTSDETVVYSKVSMTAKALGHGKVQLYANGDPNAKAQLAFYRLVTGKDPLLASGTSSSYGSGTVIVKLPTGTRKVYAVYKSPGTNTGTSAIVSVKVK